MYNSNFGNNMPNRKEDNWQATGMGANGYRPFNPKPQKPTQGGWNTGADMTSQAFRGAADTMAFGIPIAEMGDSLADWATGKQIDPTLYSNSLGGSVDQFTDQISASRMLKSLLGIGAQSQQQEEYVAPRTREPGVYTNVPSYSCGGLVRRKKNG